MKRSKDLIFASVLLAFAAMQAAACPYAYVINFSGQFGLVDLATGAFTPVGKGLPNTPDGIAGKPGGPFYTVDGITGHLLRITTDGNVTDVGDTHTGANAGPNGISLIGALTDGTLYALDFSNRLFRIDANTAKLTLVAYLSTLAVQVPEYAGNMVTSLNGDREKLYFTLQILEGPEQTGPNLYVIDPKTGAVSNYGVKLNDLVIGSGLVNGVFYLFGAGGTIFTLDTATHRTAVVASYDSGITPDGPPFTGIFGAIEPMEPVTVVPKSHETATAATRHVRWPSRSLPRY